MKTSLKTTSFSFAFLGILATTFFLFQSLKYSKLEELTQRSKIFSEGSIKTSDEKNIASGE